jgi:proteasome lid subunit RPN8/RPN11
MRFRVFRVFRGQKLDLPTAAAFFEIVRCACGPWNFLLYFPSMAEEITISRTIFNELVRICVDALPRKAFGLVGGPDIYHPKSFYPCSTNLRNTLEWKQIFESFGEFYKNPDLGFVITSAEVKTVLETMDARKELFIGVFHSHRYLPAKPSEADIALNSDPSLFSYIVSVADPAAVEVGIFRLNGNGYQNIPVVQF